MPFRARRILWLAVPRWPIKRLKGGLAEFLQKTCDHFRGGFQTGAPASRRGKGLAAPKHPFWLSLSLIFLGVLAAAEFSTRLFPLPAVCTMTFSLLIVLRSRFSEGWYTLRKLAAVAISVCVLYSFWTLMNWRPLWRIVGPFGLTRREAGFWLILVATFLW